MYLKKRIYLFLNVLLVLLIVTLCGCYEGRSRNSKDNSGGGGGVIPKDAVLPYYFILFEPIVLSKEALNSAACFSGPESERNYRFNEWTQRIALIRAGLEQIADKVFVNEVSISPEDCKNMNIIENRATVGFGANNNSLPSTPDPKNRLSVHLKAAFWDRDLYALYPVRSIRAVDWKDVIQLRSLNIETVSLHYFVNSNPQWGFFEYWRGGLSTSSYRLITGIQNPDPGGSGIVLREQKIKTDTLEFFEWFKGAALDQAYQSH